MYKRQEETEGGRKEVLQPQHRPTDPSGRVKDRESSQVGLGEVVGQADQVKFGGGRLHTDQAGAREDGLADHNALLLLHRYQQVVACTQACIRRVRSLRVVILVVSQWGQSAALLHSG